MSTPWSIPGHDIMADLNAHLAYLRRCLPGPAPQPAPRPQWRSPEWWAYQHRPMWPITPAEADILRRVQRIEPDPGWAANTFPRYIDPTFWHDRTDPPAKP